MVFYRRRKLIANITPGMGSRLGMASGALGGCIFAVLLSVGTVALHAWDQIRQKVIELVEQTAARNPDPQAQQALEFFKTEQGIVLLIVSAMIGTLVAFVIFSWLGGALGAIRSAARTGCNRKNRAGRLPGSLSGTADRI